MSSDDDSSSMSGSSESIWEDQTLPEASENVGTRRSASANHHEESESLGKRPRLEVELEEILDRCDPSEWSSVPLEAEWLYIYRGAIEAAEQELSKCIESCGSKTSSQKLEHGKEVLASLEAERMSTHWLLTSAEVNYGELEEVSNRASSREGPLSYAGEICDQAKRVVASRVWSEVELREALASMDTGGFNVNFTSLIEEEVGRTRALELEIGGSIKTTFVSSQEKVSQAFTRVTDFIHTRTTLLRKASRLRILLPEPLLVQLSVSLVDGLGKLLRLWTGHRKFFNGFGPRWLFFFQLRAIGGVLLTQSPSVGELGWISSQLSCCNEVLKDAKKSVADFAATRFLVPLFHCNLFEPMVKLQQGFEQKFGRPIQLHFDQQRQLESITTADPAGRVLERFFPTKVSQLGEPENSQQVSREFLNRVVPSSLDEAISHLLRVSKLVREDVKSARSSRTPVGEKSQSQTGSSSFAKFLTSAAFLSLGEEISEDHRVDAAAELKSNSTKNFFQQYLALSDEGVVEKEMVTGESIGEVPSMPAHFTAHSIGPPKIIAPPKALVMAAASAPPPSSSCWTGLIIGPRSSNYRFRISLFPLFSHPPPAQIRTSILSKHAAWQFEGSMGVGKFSEYYAKLIQPEHRRKREPYSFGIGLGEEEDVGAFVEKLAVNVAHAFAIVLAPYKLKLWLLHVDRRVGGAEPNLPLVPGVVFGLVEFPLPLFPNPEGVRNYLGESPLLAAVERLEAEGFKLRVPLDEEEVVEIDHHPNLPAEQPPDAMTRVFDLISSNSKEYTEPLTHSNHEATASHPHSIPSYIGSTQHTSQHTTQRPWSSSSLVIGAPSSGNPMATLAPPRKGPCKFFNLNSSCQSGPTKCRFAHVCSLCGSEDHGASFHGQFGSAPFRF